MNWNVIDFDLLSNCKNVAVTCYEQKDGSTNVWELSFDFPTEGGEYEMFSKVIEPDNPTMHDGASEVDEWCFCDYVDINFWKDLEGLPLPFGIYPVEENTSNEDGGATYTNTFVKPILGTVSFL